MWRIITPMHFVITPISVGFHWDSLDERKSGGLAESTLRLKYIIIQLQVKQKKQLLQTTRWQNMSESMGEGGTTRA